MAEESTKRPARRTERIGKYEIVSEVARGGMGIVYKARDVDLNRVVALKILPFQLAKQETTLIRFQREAKAAAKLRHENIVAIYDVGDHLGTFYIAFEFVEGTDLQDYINRKCKLDPEEARQIMIQAARALDHAHEQGIVHRDIKPSNLLLTQKGSRLIVKLTDFGLAIAKEDDEEFRITRDKTTVGTVDYISPEQARDSRSVDIRGDIYSLGCTFFHMLAGVAPFARGTLPERILMHMQAPMPNLRKLNQSVPDDLVAVIHRMLEKKPEDRYQTPAELLHDLEHPDEVLPAEKESGGRLQRGPGRRRNADPTAVVDLDGLEADAGKPSKAGQVKKRPAKKGADTEADGPNEDERPESRTPPKKAGAPGPVSADKSKRPAAGSPLWMYVAGGSVGVLGLVLIAALLFGGKPGPLKKPVEPIKKSDQPDIVEIDPKEKEKPPEVKADTSAANMGVAALPLPRMDTANDKPDLVALRKQFYGPFTAFPETPKGALVLRVSRLGGGAGALRTLEAAFAASKLGGFTVIEINDGGPFFVSALPVLAERTILVRGGAGYRPLIVWDMPKNATPGKLPASFCSLAQGSLILDNLDFVMRCSGDAPASVFELPASDFQARHCTFSLAGGAPRGLALVNRPTATEEKPATRPTHFWLQHCYVRGPELTLLQSRDATAAVLVEDSLVVGHQQPLFHVRGRDADAFSLYCVRSTLVCGKTLVHWQPQATPGAAAPIHGRILDSILSRDDTTAPVGDLIYLADGADASAMSWRAVNSVYAGWKQLLASGAKYIAADDLDGWHRQWRYSFGDRSVADAWPTSPPPKLEEQPAARFLPAQPVRLDSAEPAPVAFAALTGTGSTGCIVGRLPPTPESWLERTLEPRAVPTIAAADTLRPEIDKAPAGLFHGAELNLNKVDLGAYLAGIQKKEKLAPRVVLHLTGRGVCSTSPVRIKGIGHLVLHFEATKDARDAITLEANPGSLTPPALIEMTGGHLEVIGARFQLSPGTLVPMVLQLHNADLTLTRCWLQGPLISTPDRFQCLLAAANTSGEPRTLLLRDNVLVSGKLLLDLRDAVQLRARNNLFVSLADAVHFDGSAAGGPLMHVLDHNSWATRNAYLTFGKKSTTPSGDLVLFHANSNAFLAPFTEDPDKTTLLRIAEPWVAQGRWNWQGRYNVYDARLNAYFAGIEKAAAAKQTLSDWQTTWGQAGEQNASLLGLGPGTKAAMIDIPALMLQLDRLALPKELRGDPGQNPPGADLTVLGLKKKV